MHFGVLRGLGVGGNRWGSKKAARAPLRTSWACTLRTSKMASKNLSGHLGGIEGCVSCGRAEGKYQHDDLDEEDK